MRVHLLYQPLVPGAEQLAGELGAFLAAGGHQSAMHSLLDSPPPELPPGTDLVVTFGGDGSLLRSTHLATPARVPVVGVNLGRVGFLAELDPHAMPEAILPYLEGRAFVEDRALVEAIVHDGERQFVNLQEPPSPASLPLLALNEVFVGRGAIGRLVRLTVRINGRTLGQFRADGVIVATPTGSTAYGLAAGGPVIGPDVDALLLVAVSAQASPVRSLVLPSSALVEIRVDADHPPVLSSDGLFDVALQPGDTVLVKQSSQKAHFLRRETVDGFYSGLVERLR